MHACNGTQMSFENYRDLKERAFDRYRLGAQVLEGDAVNVMPAKQPHLEKKLIKDARELEIFRAQGMYVCICVVLEQHRLSFASSMFVIVVVGFLGNHNCVCIV